jgi:hypothetical protein
MRQYNFKNTIFFRILKDMSFILFIFIYFSKLSLFAALNYETYFNYYNLLL